MGADAARRRPAGPNKGKGGAPARAVAGGPAALRAPAWIPRLPGQHKANQLIPVSHHGVRSSANNGTQANANLLRSFISGGIAGMTAKTIEAPLDRVKIIFQTTQLRFSFPAAANMMRSLARDEGLRSLWKGNGVVMLRVAPYAALHFTAHEWLCTALKRPDEDTPRVAIIKKFLAGAGAGAFGTCVLYPLDVARAKMAVAPPGTCRNLWETVGTLAGSGRGIRGLYWGLGPTLLGILVYSGTTWTIYETLKEHPPLGALKLLVGPKPDAEEDGGKQGRAKRRGAAAARSDETTKASLSSSRTATTTAGTGSASTATSTSHSEHAFYGGFAGISGQVVAYPLDVLRRRMQTTQLGNPMPVTVLGQMIRTEGVGSLFKGLSVNFIKGPIATGISFMTYNATNDFLSRVWPM